MGHYQPLEARLADPAVRYGDPGTVCPKRRRRHLVGGIVCRRIEWNPRPWGGPGDGVEPSCPRPGRRRRRQRGRPSWLSGRCYGLCV